MKSNCTLPKPTLYPRSLQASNRTSKCLKTGIRLLPHKCSFKLRSRWSLLFRVHPNSYLSRPKFIWILRLRHLCLCIDSTLKYLNQRINNTEETTNRIWYKGKTKCLNFTKDYLCLCNLMISNIECQSWACLPTPRFSPRAKGTKCRILGEVWMKGNLWGVLCQLGITRQSKAFKAARSSKMSLTHRMWCLTSLRG